MKVKRIGLVLAVLIFFGLTILGTIRVNHLTDQMAYLRWGSKKESAQVTVFIEKGTEVNDFMIRSFENALDHALLEASIAPKEHARLYLDAYSAKGKLTLKSDRATLETEAIGIGNDFFYFHPATLVSGRYFSGEELMKDFVILDEDAAWQLYGSSDIEGMSVMIAGVPHTIAGVIQKDSSKLAKKAGLSKSVVYTSYETLSELGETTGIDCYEVTGANPVKGFLAKCVREKLGLKEDQILVIENSSRFTTEALLNVLLDFGTRSMQNSAISVPYWENMARGTEDLLAVLLLIRVCCILWMLGVLVHFIVLKWKNRTYRGKEFWKMAGGIYEKKALEIRNRIRRNPVACRMRKEKGE